MELITLVRGNEKDHEIIRCQVTRFRDFCLQNKRKKEGFYDSRYFLCSYFFVSHHISHFLNLLSITAYLRLSCSTYHVRDAY